MGGYMTCNAIGDAKGGLGLIKKQRRKFKRRRGEGLYREERKNKEPLRGNGELGSFGCVMHGEEEVLQRGAVSRARGKMRMRKGSEEGLGWREGSQRQVRDARNTSRGPSMRT